MSESSHFDTLREKAEQAPATPSRRRKRVPVDPSIDPYEIPLAELNVANPELFRAEAMWPYFDRLRDEAPVHFCSDSQYGPYWSITRYDDIMAIEKNHEVFSSDFSLGGVTLMGTPASGNDMPMFIQMDPPKHDAQRKAVAPKFTQRNLGELESTVRERVASILDGLPLNETFNWVEHVSVELTAQMLATILGVHQDDRHQLITWSNIFSNADNPDVVQDKALFYEALAECGEYMQALWRERQRSQPTGDLVSMLAHGAQTKDMDARELLGNAVLLIVGGNDTTRNSISGGLLALNEFPEQYEKLRADPSLIRTLVPEIIRWQTPLTHMRRTALADIEFRGQQIRKGDKVVMWYLSGNRDPDAIDRPDEFIIDRPRPREHLSFGFGVHRCLGNRLAELQLRVLWEEIMARYPNIEVVGEPQRLSSVLFRAIQELPVRIAA
ncbi:MAG: cytochrome P450 [Gammaproteobacteria bacterium]|nr:cytochrome P450 [Gammaproteobacteria bacterium]